MSIHRIARDRERDRDRRDHRIRSVAAVYALSSLLIAWSVVWGRRFERRERRIKLGAAPFVGRWHVHVTPALLAVLLVVAAQVLAGRVLLPRLCDRLVLLWSAVAAVIFAFALAAADGFSAVLAPVVDPNEYWSNLIDLPPAATMLRRFNTYDFLVVRSVHLRGHPPGFILLLKGLRTIGLGAPWVAGALSFIGVAMLVCAVGVTTRVVAGSPAMRRMLPFLTVAPFAVWLGTSADALYSGVAATGIACVAIGVRRERTRAQLAFGSAAGVILGSALFLTYGAATLAPLVVAVAIVPRNFRRTFRVGLAVIGGMVAVYLGFSANGFSWFRGLRLTNKFYWNGSAYFRTWTYFLLANIAVLLVALGPAVVAGIATLREARVWIVVGGALVCLLIAEGSQYSKGEVERIWLLFMPWLVPATAVLGVRRAADDASVPVPIGWLIAQVTFAIVLQVTLRSKW